MDLFILSYDYPEYVHFLTLLSLKTSKKNATNQKHQTLPKLSKCQNPLCYTVQYQREI